MSSRRRSKKNKYKVTTKTALSKSALRSARKNEQEEIDIAISSVREPNIKNIQVIEEDINDDTIINLYKDYSIPEISSMFNISEDKIMSVLVCNEYTQNGKTIKNIIDMFGITKYKTTKILQENNVVMRARGKAKAAKNEDDNTNTSDTDTSIVAETDMPSINITDEDLEDNKKNDIYFCNQVIRDKNVKALDFSKYTDNITVAGLVKDRHVIPFVNKYIFDTLTQDQFNNPEDVEEKALNFIKDQVNPDTDKPTKTLILYCTGLQLALSAVVAACAKNGVNLITMHYNSDTSGYICNNTLAIFGNVPDVSDINVLNNLSKRYGGGVYTYDCTIKDLIDADSCTYVTLNNNNSSNKEIDCIVLFNKTFPDANVWEFFGKMIAASREKGFKKEHSIQLGQITISSSGYTWGDTFAKSYNYRSYVNNN